MAERRKRLERGTYIGGQQIAAVVGMHPYMSIGNVYAHSVYGEPHNSDFDYDDDPSSQSVLRRGIICEAGLIDYIERVSLELPTGTLKRDVFYQDNDVPFFAGTVDAMEMDAAGRPYHVHEVTVTSTRALEPWGADGDPYGAAKYKHIQNLWYQGISGARGGTVWLFVSDTGEIRRYPIGTSADAINSLRIDGEKFWLEHVLCKNPPIVEADSLEQWALSEGSISAIYQGEKGKVLDYSDELGKAAHEYNFTRAEYKSAEERKKGAAAKLKQLMGENSDCKWDDGSVTWRRSKDSVKVNYESAVKSLAEKLAFDDAELKSFMAAHTSKRPGARPLRVTLKQKK